MADLLVLGAIVVRAAVYLWSGQSLPDEVATPVLDVLRRKLRGAPENDSLEALVDSLEEKVTRRITAAMDVEFHDLPSYEREAAMLALQGSLRGLSLTDLIATDLSADRLRQHVAANDPAATRDLSDAATRLYFRALDECCRLVVELANRAPGFKVGVLGELLTRMGTSQHSLDDIRDLLNTMLPVVAGTRPDAVAEFEATYRGIVSRQLDRLEILGLSALGARAYSLTTAYVALDIDAGDVHDRLRELSFADEDEPVDRHRQVSIEEALAVSTRLLLRGEAGCGKTTVLQWIAVRCARGDLPESMSDWNGLVPFYIKLRTWGGRRLPRPGDFLEDVGCNIAEVMPEGWVASVLGAGRAVVLIDGVDELPESERDAVRAWLGDLIDTFQDCRFVVSSRPSAAKDEWLAPFAFDVARIEPMRMDAVRAFVKYWHTAYAAANEDDAEAAARAIHNGDEIINQIVASRALQQIAGTPLLTALLCVMYLSEEYLPSDRLRLYDKAIDIILAQRRRAGDDGVLTARDTVLVLHPLAYWMVSNGKSYMQRNVMLRQLGTRLRALHVSVEPEAALAFLLDRSGLLREPQSGRVDFIHRTFQEYLAAAAAIDNDEIGTLVLRGDDDQWHQVVIMAVGLAKRTDREKLISGLLDRATAEPAKKATLNALAIACLETARDIDDSVRTRVEEIAASLLPPRTMTDANMLAAVGELALDLVSQHAITAPRTAAATIRMAGQIGGEGAMREMARCALVRGRDVHGELLSAWGRSEMPDRFAREILARSAIHEFVIHDPALIPGLRHLDISKLTVRFARGFGSVAFVRQLETLRSLIIEQDPALIDLGGLAGHAHLRNLCLVDTGKLDLEPLATLALTDLQLKTRSITDVSRVAALANLTSLRLTGDLGDRPLGTMLAETAQLKELWLIDAARLDGLGQLSIPQLGRLKTLAVRDAPQLRRLDGLDQWANHLTELCLQNARLARPDQIAVLTGLRTLNLRGTSLRSLDFIVSLPELRTLYLGGLGVLPGLGPLHDHLTLNRMHIGGKGTVDLRPLAGRKNTTFYVYGSHRRQIHGRDGLGAGSNVVQR